MMRIKTVLRALTAFALTQLSAQADTVLTTDGAHLTGTIILINKGVIHLETNYAGTLEIQQALVQSFDTEAPVFVRLANGATMAGPVQSAGAGKLKIQSPEGVLETDMGKVIASWNTAGEDPAFIAEREAAEAHRRKWKFKGGVNLLGKDGNTEEFSLGVNFEAKLISPNDELAFFGDYDNREKNGDQTEDRLKGGTSYESFFHDHYGWYVRSELEQDAIDEIDLRSTSGAGISLRLINEEHQKLVARSGIGYRYTTYANDTEHESSATLDFGLAHEYKFKNLLTMESDLTYVPSGDDFGNYSLVHDSGIVVPIGTVNNWKLRMGIMNEYESQPAAEVKLDTTYYTRMIYEWD